MHRPPAGMPGEKEGLSAHWFAGHTRGPRSLPILTWGAAYSRQTLTNGLIVAAIVTIMLIPQSLAYALLAGLPAQVGLYASMAPLLVYAIFGTSRALAVGPAAVASLLTATAAGAVARQGTPEYLGAAIALAVVSGLLLLAMGLLRLGFLANFLSHPVISGFITASGIQIVGLSIGLHLYATSTPHVAVVGQIPGTMTFRNVTRHAVVTDPAVLSMRLDESLYFPNARFLEDCINAAVADNPAVRHVILECPAVNAIDTSGLESLEAINHRLKDAGITFHLSEVKGPVMDRLKGSHFLQELTGKVHLTHFDAVASINPDLALRTLHQGGSRTAM